MDRFKTVFCRLRAYTLTEIVVIMLIIAVVVGISVKSMKRKMDNIPFYTYYTAFSTVRETVNNMVIDFSPSNEDYFTSPLPSGTCNFANGEEDNTTGGCMPILQTIPRTGSKFCEMFAEYVNTMPNTDDCNGDDVSSSTTSFKDLDPALTLVNGIRIYNLGNIVQKFELLSHTGSAPKYKDGADNLIKIDEYGYTLYVDIDGFEGTSTLWQDVYPFYITMDGRTIPAYRSLDGAGGNDKGYLQVSVANTKYDASGNRSVDWVKKSVSFREAACASGFINKNTTYCNGITNSDCDDASDDCKMKYVNPVKLF